MRPEVVQHPSGRQYGIRHGDQRATVVQVGGALREYEVAGFPVLDGFGVEELAGPARGQPLVPWPNRIADGRYEFGGRTLQVSLSEPARHNAIHGLVRWSCWELLDASASRVHLGHVLYPQDGYPFLLALEIEYELSDDGLRATIAAENAGRGPAPFGAGQHPYVRAELGTIDRSLLQLGAGSWLELDERQVPTGRMLAVDGTGYDFRAPRPLAGTRLDTAFTDLARDRDGRACVELCSADGGRRVTVWMDGGFDYVMLFSGDGLADGERRRSLGVEPMTCAPDAFRNGLGLRVLEPGERLSVSWGISARR